MTFNGFNWPKQLAIALRERWLQVTVNVCVVTLNVEVKVRRSDRNEIKREAVSEAVGPATRGVLKTGSLHAQLDSSHVFKQNAIKPRKCSQEVVLLKQTLTGTMRNDLFFFPLLDWKCEMF